jgi:thiosulfate reductase cytochrome b subunit
MIKYIAIGIVLACILVIAGLAIWRPSPATQMVGKIISFASKTGGRS